MARIETLDSHEVDSTAYALAEEHDVQLCFSPENEEDEEYFEIDGAPDDVRRFMEALRTAQSADPLLSDPLYGDIYGREDDFLDSFMEGRMMGE